MSAVLAYESSDGQLCIEAPGSHRVSSPCKGELLAAMHELKPRKGARLMLFGNDVERLGDKERIALLGRVGFVPANGGLVSTLNAWENISLPVAYHTPEKLGQALAEVEALLDELGGVDEGVLAKLPEEMTLYERRLAAFIRALLERPELLVVETLTGGLGPTKRARAAHFAHAYHARCPAGTFVQFDA
jgi:phospholipid/cholesterol/gamma-HCH transport system ATP-binding protein